MSMTRVETNFAVPGRWSCATKGVHDWDALPCCSSADRAASFYLDCRWFESSQQDPQLRVRTGGAHEP